MKKTILLLSILLSGCKIPLYSQLSESEANRMMAVLIYHKIEVDKKAEKEGVALSVEKNDFVNSVEILRQNGLPRTQTISMEKMFPSGQLVTSPAQETAKLVYFQAQELRKLLESFDGVVMADVAISLPVPKNASTDSTNDEMSLSVFIKYSPRVNMDERVESIRQLCVNAISGLKSQKISISLQPAEYLYQDRANEVSQDISADTSNKINVVAEKVKFNDLLFLPIAGAGIFILFLLWFFLRKKSK
jgi:type III secretion protein J